MNLCLRLGLRQGLFCMMYGGLHASPHTMAYLPNISHLLPVNSAGHEQENAPPDCEHTPPFTHGLDEHEDAEIQSWKRLCKHIPKVV